MRTSWLLPFIILGFIKVTTQTVNTTCDLTKEFDCGTGALGCLPKAWQCDNVKDCHNGADEVDCEPNICQKGELLCEDGPCVKGEHKCDGVIDCSSDEKYCEYNSRRLNVPAPFNFGDPNLYDSDSGLDKNGCLPGFGFCPFDKTCIHNHAFCTNSISFHCSESDAERNCTREKPIEKSFTRLSENPCKDKFVCKTNETYKDEVCIQMNELCNGKEECPLGEDESEKCSECSTKHCEYQCKNTPTGPKFECKQGYRLASDGFSCVDLDECTLPERACDHFCQNQIGSFRCSCVKGYDLKADGKTCELTNTNEGFLLISYYNSIERKPLEDFTEANFTSVHKRDGLIQGFDYSRRDDKIFMLTWEGFGELVVVKNGKSTILRDKLTSPTPLVVDWIGGNIYFTEHVHNYSMIARTSVCTMDGKFCRVIIEASALSHDTALTIHPMRGLLFFNEFIMSNFSSRIMMANMDGSQVQPLFESNNTHMRALAIDYEKHDLYFRDLYQNDIKRINIDTKKIEVVASNLPFLTETSVIAYHNGFLYWIESHGILRVLEVARDGASVHNVQHSHHFLTGLQTHLVVNDSLHQLVPAAGNPCEEVDCPWICVIVPDFTAKCLCPDGYTPSILGTTCIPSLTEVGEHDIQPHIGLDLMSEYCKAGVGCLNGGSCREVFNKTRIVCDCVEPYDGLYCERRKPILSDEAILIVILVIVLLILLIAIGYGAYWFFFYRKNKKDGVSDTISIVSKSTIGGTVYYENDAVSLG
ncbi:unnamed protein product [Caenorhabditis brenneri]